MVLKVFHRQSGFKDQDEHFVSTETQQSGKLKKGIKEIRDSEPSIYVRSLGGANSSSSQWQMTLLIQFLI